MNAAALIVGIDAYRSAPRLGGAVQDAVDAATWLISIGVPPDRIHLHCARAPDDTPVPALPCTWDDIWDSIQQIKESSGDKLFVFLSGHGLYVPAEGAIFLTEEWSDTRRLHANLGLNDFIQYFLSFDYRDQFVICDACQNPSNPPSRRARVEPRGPAEGGRAPRNDTALTLCCAASQGQVAYLINGRGLLTRRLLTFLEACAKPDPPREAQGAIVHDWLTGERHVDLREAFRRVAQQVQHEAREFGVQTPQLIPFGRAASESFSLVHAIAPGFVETATIEVEPDGLDYISLNLMPPVVELTLPLMSQHPPFPTFVKVPRGARLVGECMPRPGWIADPEADTWRVPEGGLTLRFHLRRPPSGRGGLRPDTPTPPDGLAAAPSSESVMAAYRITLLDEAGEPQPAPYHIHESGIDVESGQLAGVEGIRVEEDETGIQVWFPIEHLTAARKLAEEWRELLGVLFQDFGLQAFLGPLSYEGAAGKPNVLVRPPIGGLEQLAGYLTQTTEIRFNRVGALSNRDSQAVPLESLNQQGFVRLGAGQWRAQLELPWGTWEEAFDTSEEIVRLRLPDRIGHPPLRNRFLLTGAEEMGPLLFLPGERRGVRSDRPRRQPDGTFTQDWRVGDRFFRVPLGPFEGLRFLATTGDGTLRLEPWSDTPLSEWDMLVSAGRLQDLDLDRAIRRLEGGASAGNQAAMSILLLALAYAAYTQDRIPQLDHLIAQSDPRTAETPDAKLLRCVVEGKERLQEPVGLPLFRWGLPLLARLTPEGVAEAAIVPSSEWTVLEMTAALA